jgi:hypothetical protein
VQAKVVKPTDVEQVWSSVGCLSPSKASIWKPGNSVLSGFKGLGNELTRRDQQVRPRATLSQHPDLSL